jgi:hypothetical protein
MRSIEPGIHNHSSGLWIPGLRQMAHPGMTVSERIVADSIVKQPSVLNTPPRSRRAMRPSDAGIVRPKQMEGAGNAGCALHPQSHVQNKKAHEVVTTGSPEQSGIPRAMVLTAYSALSPVIGLSCHRRKRDTSR